MYRPQLINGKRLQIQVTQLHLHSSKQICPVLFSNKVLSRGHVAIVALAMGIQLKVLCYQLTENRKTLD